MNEFKLIIVIVCIIAILIVSDIDARRRVRREIEEPLKRYLDFIRRRRK